MQNNKLAEFEDEQNQHQFFAVRAKKLVLSWVKESSVFLAFSTSFCNDKKQPLARVYGI